MPQSLHSPPPPPPGAVQLVDEGTGADDVRAEESGNAAQKGHHKGKEKEPVEEEPAHKKGDPAKEENQENQTTPSTPTHPPSLTYRIWTELVLRSALGVSLSELKCQLDSDRWEVFLEEAVERLQMYAKVSGFALSASIGDIIMGHQPFAISVVRSTIPRVRKLDQKQIKRLTSESSHSLMFRLCGIIRAPLKCAERSRFSSQSEHLGMAGRC
ncbi:hypothetical protein F4604DRAFT_1725945 [Suillus subluteus]|nr:hypothetical protein F4604DRAFT_1725945 [Suillus subluteus]